MCHWTYLNYVLFQVKIEGYVISQFIKGVCVWGGCGCVCVRGVHIAGASLGKSFDIMKQGKMYSLFQGV